MDALVMQERIENGYERLQIPEHLLVHASLCEHIAKACNDEKSAAKFMDMARQCRMAAAAN